MRKIKQLAALSGVAVMLCSGAGRLAAQNAGGPGGPGGFGGGGFGGGAGGGGPGGPGGGGGFGGGNFDPAQMQQMMEDMRKQMSDTQREQLEVKDDAEWTVIAAQIQKVTDARAQISTGGGGGMFGGGRRGGRGGPGGPGGPGGFGGGPGGPGGPGGFTMPGMPVVQPDPAAEALQKAVDDKASPEQLKAAVARLVESRKQKQAALDTAQSDLRKLLSVRQEAIAYIMGLL